MQKISRVRDTRQALTDKDATLELGARLAPILRAGDVVCLSGPLGAGKTTLARGLIAALTGAEEAPSPTYALVETYDAADFQLWHFDLYRLERAEDAYELGLEDAFADGASLIEWPERIERLIPAGALLIRLEPDGEARQVLIRADDAWARRLEAIDL